MRAMRAHRATRVTMGSAAALLPQRPAPRVKALALLEPQSPKAASCRCSCTPPTRMAAAQSRLPLRWQRVPGETSIGASVPAGSIAAARHNKSIFVAEQFEAAPAAAATAEAGARCDRGSKSTTRCRAAGRRSLLVGNLLRAALLCAPRRLCLALRPNPRRTAPPALTRATAPQRRSAAPPRRRTARTHRVPLTRSTHASHARAQN